MAEFCLDCFNKYIGNKKLAEKDVIVGMCLCEQCGEWKPCVIRIKDKNIFSTILSIFTKLKNPRS